MEEINRMRNGIIVYFLTGFDIVEIVKCGGNILEVFEGFVCLNLEYNPFTEFVTDMFEKKRAIRVTRKGFISKSSSK